MTYAALVLNGYLAAALDGNPLFFILQSIGVPRLLVGEFHCRPGDVGLHNVVVVFAGGVKLHRFAAEDGVVLGADDLTPSRAERVCDLTGFHLIDGGCGCRAFHSLTASAVGNVIIWARIAEGVAREVVVVCDLGVGCVMLTKYTNDGANQCIIAIGNCNRSDTEAVLNCQTATTVIAHKAANLIRIRMGRGDAAVEAAVRNSRCIVGVQISYKTAHAVNVARSYVQRSAEATGVHRQSAALNVTYKTAHLILIGAGGVCEVHRGMNTRKCGVALAPTYDASVIEVTGCGAVACNSSADGEVLDRSTVYIAEQTESALTGDGHSKIPDGMSASVKGAGVLVGIIADGCPDLTIQVDVRSHNGTGAVVAAVHLLGKPEQVAGVANLIYTVYEVGGLISFTADTVVLFIFVIVEVEIIPTASRTSIGCCAGRIAAGMILCAGAAADGTDKAVCHRH